MNTLENDINEFLRTTVPTIKQGTTEASLEIIVWVRILNRTNQTIILGFALGNNAGCSPFCKCAESQLLRLLTPKLKTQFPEITEYRIYGVATIPPNEVVAKWKTP